MMSFKHSHISPSTRTLFGLPRGISSTLPSLTYCATMLLTVDLFVPKASTTERKSSFGFSKAPTSLWRCSKRILFLVFISAITILTGQMCIVIDILFSQMHSRMKLMSLKLVLMILYFLVMNSKRCISLVSSFSKRSKYAYH